MKISVRTALAFLLLSPGLLSAHPNHGPGELDHWLIGLLFVGLSVALIGSLKATKPKSDKTSPKRRSR